ncbi:Na(+)-translocating NADH-quinone reductase subunit A [Pseudooceanicola marinus]|uniref:Na(+)-translocating NADH-quinone reductase subunit A n=1 Tax=Pseudooceanicola marinus TaxID=396013 RepID=A0A1X6ZDG7_9RHOB|nr:Na(+)-translocating NADH-quinone reductase subunit A [Pseudooceanicola marinus]PJE28310.1 Na(+)-translocating NADH-quinone reductase subunit A [Pseudooceanicola marinus]SLN47675.1 Na(+)-translocating NADH-quinone reductase subunit A [Pseudooceanicola marinus]
MLSQLMQAGLSPNVRSAPLTGGEPVEHWTEEAAVVPQHREHLRVDMVVREGEAVAGGAPVARLRDHPEIALVAPMPGRVAKVHLGPGRQLHEIVLFRDAGGDMRRHDTEAAGAGDGSALRALLQDSGLWRQFRARPFGRMPAPDAKPAAILVMAADSRPLAPDPLAMLEARGEDLMWGLAALGHLTEGPVYLCQRSGPALAGPGAVEGRLRLLRSGPRHPQGLAGHQLHHHHPASVAAPVWDIHAEDVADLGTLLETGLRPALRTVSVTGPALSEARLLRCQDGAHLAGLCHGLTVPGPHDLVSGSALDGHRAVWLAPRDRQLSVMTHHHGAPRGHWFRNALSRAARPVPLIPTAALEQALGGALPAVALLRALSAGDDETLAKLGGLTLLEEDLALADYVTGAEPRLSALLRGALDRIAAEEGA